MGLLDGVFGGSQQQQQPAQAGPPAQDTWWDRFRAQYAPGAYAAHQNNLQQQAIYSAMLQNGATPAQAQAMAASPQFFAAGQGAYMPAAPQVQTYTNSAGEQIPIQIQNPGGAAGHGLSLSGIPIGAPGTTANPTQAASGARGAQEAGPNDSGAQGNVAQQPAQQTGPTNSLQGMPGSTNQTLQVIDSAKAQGVEGEDLLKVVPREFQDMTRAYLDGRMTLKEIAERRGNASRTIVSKLALAIDPEYDENMNEARQTYRKQYVSGKATDIGGQVKSINKLAGHANAMADASLGMNNYGAGGAAILAHPLNAIGNQLNSTPGAGLKRAADLYTNELSSYVSGKGGSGVEERKQRSEAFSPNATPQEMGNSLLTDIEFLEKQIQGNEQQRNAVFKDPNMQGQFPLVSPEARQQLDQAKVKAHKLIGDYDQWSKSPEGMAASGNQNAANPTLPKGWKLVK